MMMPRQHIAQTHVPLVTQLWDWIQAHAVLLAAGLSFVAEGVHLFIVPLQYAIFAFYGLFFMVAAMGQGGTGVLLLFAPGRRVLRWTTRLNAFLVGSYVITHTLGVLTGIGFTRLPLDGWGVVATLAELGIVALLVVARQQRGQFQKTAVLRTETPPAVQ